MIKLLSFILTVGVFSAIVLKAQLDGHVLETIHIQDAFILSTAASIVTLIIHLALELFVSSIKGDPDEPTCKDDSN